MPEEDQFTDPEPDPDPDSRALEAVVRRTVEAHVRQILKECDGNKTQAADILKISRTTLYRLLGHGYPYVKERFSLYVFPELKEGRKGSNKKLDEGE